MRLFKGTVRENLLMARPNAGEDTLWQVLEQVKLADFFRSEGGLDMVLNEKASNLSGGQRQRLALARALLHDSPVYIFDEATSNLDSLNEAVILKSLQEARSGKTVVPVSHRKSTMGIADTIHCVEHGRMS